MRSEQHSKLLQQSDKQVQESYHDFLLRRRETSHSQASQSSIEQQPTQLREHNSYAENERKDSLPLLEAMGGSRRKSFAGGGGSNGSERS